MGFEPKEKINNPFKGTIYEGGYGYSFSYFMNHPDYDLDMKYVITIYGLFFNYDGSGSCTVHRDKLINDIAHMKARDFIHARNRLVEADAIKICTRRQNHSPESGRLMQDTNEVTLNLTPKGFVENEEAGIRFKNILSYHYGQLPRCFFMDTSLEKTDKVIASYIFANMGKIREYLLSGVKIRESLRTRTSNGDMKEMSRYKFEQAIKRLKPYMEFRLMCDAEVLAWRKLKYGETAEKNTHGDFYIVTIKNGLDGTKEEHSFSMNNYSSAIVSPENLGTAEDFRNVDNSNLGTAEEGTPEEGTAEEGTAEEGTPINSPISEKGLSSQKHYVYNKSLYPHNPSAKGQRDSSSDDEKTFHDQINNENESFSKRCPLELRQRLGEKEARYEVEVLYSVLHQIDEECYIDRLCRVNGIIDSLYEIAQTSPKLEEYALAVNVVSLISHRAIDYEIRNIGGYVRRILENAREDQGFVAAPVYELSSYRAYLDGYKLSNNGVTKRELIKTSQNEQADNVELEVYINELLDYIKANGYKKGENIYISDTPLPPALTNDRSGRRALARVLFSFFRKSSYHALKDTYYGTYANGENWLDDAILTFQEAIMELWNPQEDFYFADDVHFDRHYYSKCLMSLFYISYDKLMIKSNIYEKVIALFLNAQSQKDVVNKIKWIKTTIANELRFAHRLKDGNIESIDLSDPVPAFKETSRNNNRKIFNYMDNDIVRTIPPDRRQERRDDFDILSFIMENGPEEAKKTIANIKEGRMLG